MHRYISIDTRPLLLYTQELTTSQNSEFTLVPIFVGVRICIKTTHFTLLLLEHFLYLIIGTPSGTAEKPVARTTNLRGK